MSTPDLLYLIHRVPFPPDKGDRIRNWNVLRFLARRCRVWAACLADEPISAETRRMLDETCARVAIIPVRPTRWLGGAIALLSGRSISEGVFSSSELRRTVRAWARETKFHAAIASAGSLAPYLRLPELRDVPAIVDLVDVDSQKWFDYADSASFPRSHLYRLEGNRVRKLEREIPTWAKGVTLVSQAEVDLFAGFVEPGPVFPVTNGTDLEYFRPVDAVEELACVFIGALNYRPNVDAACWFVDAVWPNVRRFHPKLCFRLVGRQPVAAIRDLAKVPGVEVIGSVPDVRPWLASAMLAVVPLRIARGVQNKVLEAMAMAKPCVASPAALAGLRAKPGEDLLSASTPLEWAEAIAKLVGDANLRCRLGQAGRNYVETNHTWEKCLAPMADIVFGEQQPVVPM